MATTRLTIAAICWVLMTTGGWTSQTPPVPVLAANDVSASIGNSLDAQNVVAKVLTHAMANRSRREFFLANQIRREWLPAVPDVEFECLADSEIVGHLARCGRYWNISQLERIDNVVTMWLRQECGGTALHYVVSTDGKEWRLGPPGTGKGGGGWTPGIGSGFVSRPAGCPCL